MKLRYLAFLLFVGVMAAQNGPTVKPLFASDYGRWTVPATSTIPAPGVATVTLQFSTVTASSGPSFSTATINTPLLIIDTGNNETVTPSSVNCPAGGFSCTFTATFLRAHPGNFQVASGTFGLQEAINSVAGGSAATIQITQDWSGTNVIIAAAQGNANVSIQDIRNGLTIYAWNGLAYQASSQCVMCTNNGYALGPAQYGAIQSIQNDGTTGTILHGLVSVTSSNRAIRTTAAATAGAIGVCEDTCGTNGFPVIAYTGPAQVLLDGSGPNTPGHYACISSLSHAYAADCGPNGGNAEAIGIIGALVSGSVYTVQLLIGSSSSGAASGIVPAPNATQIIQSTDPALTGLQIWAPTGVNPSTNIWGVFDPTGMINYLGVYTDGSGNPYTQMGSGFGGIWNGLKEFDQVVYCQGQAGSPDIGVMINNATAQLPSTGGVVDCRGVRGNWTLSTTANLNKAFVTYLFGQIHISYTAGHDVQLNADDVSVIGAGESTIFDDTAEVTQTIPAILIGSQIDRFNLYNFRVSGNRTAFCGAGNVCQLGGNATKGSVAVKAVTSPVANPPADGGRIENVRVYDAGYIGIQLDNCTNCVIRNNFVKGSFGPGIQVNASNTTAGLMVGDEITNNKLRDDNVGCGKTKCGDGQLNVISTGGLGVLVDPLVAFNDILGGAQSSLLCDTTPVTVGGSCTPSLPCGGGEAAAKSCGQGIQITNNVSRSRVLANHVVHTFNEGIATTGTSIVVGNYGEDNACGASSPCNSGAGCIAEYVDPVGGIIKGAVISGNICLDSGYGVSIQVGTTNQAGTDSATIDGVSVTGNSVIGMTQTIPNAYRVKNNCDASLSPPCNTHNSTLKHVRFAGNTAAGSYTNAFSKPAPGTFASGLMELGETNSPVIPTGQIALRAQTAGKTNASVFTGSTSILATPSPGTYRVCYKLATATVGSGGTNIGISFTWTDANSHAKTFATGNIVSANATDITGQVQGCYRMDLGSGDITYTNTGTLGTSTFDLELDTEPQATQ